MASPSAKSNPPTANVDVPPPPYMYPPPVMMQPLPMNFTPSLGRDPMRIICPRCQRDVVTSTELKPGPLIWLLSLGILCLGGLLGCFLIPFLIDPIKDVVHKCPNCLQVIGTWRYLC